MVCLSCPFKADEGMLGKQQIDIKCSLRFHKAIEDIQYDLLGNEKGKKEIRK